MVDPIRMVVISLLASILLVLAIIFYIKIYPKKNINLFTLIIIISLLPLISVFREGSYESGDLSYHVKFAMQFYKNMQEGNLIPSWTEKQCSGYGCPYFIFIFFLSQYLISTIHLLGFSFIASAKILIAASFILSGVGMFVWIKNEFGEKPGFIAAIFYLFAPYHLIDMHFRVSIAEMVAMAFLPFLFFTTKRMIESKLFIMFIFTSFLFACLILTHQVAALASFPLLFIYGLIVWIRNKRRKLKILLLLFLSYLLGILLTSFYWIPILFESKYILYGPMTEISFNKLTDFFYSPSKLGFLFQGHYGEIYTSVGYSQWLIILIGFYILLKKKVERKDKIMLITSLILFTFIFIMMQSFTKPLWDLIPLLKSFQFSWRLLIEAMIAISIIAAIVIKTYPNRSFFIIICFITVFYTILNWGNRGAVPRITDQVLSKQMIFNNSKETIDIMTPIWVDNKKSWIGITPKKHIEVMRGDALIVETSRLTAKHEYIISAKTYTQLKENTYFFPGWELFVNNQKKPINYKNKQFPGVITFDLNKGLYKVELKFTDTPIRKIAKLISLSTLLLFGSFILLRRFLPKRLI